MVTSFVYLCVQTILLWFLVVLFYRQKNRFTLIPLYSFVAILTLFTHNLSDLGFAVVIHQWYFLISSFSFFTALMLGILFLYLFEGPRATRLALLIILGTSFFYIGVVYLLGLQTHTSQWVVITNKRLMYYFWSILAIIIDTFFIPIAWELLSKFQKLPLLIRVFLVVFGTYTLDTAVFVTGVFGGQSLYISVLRGDITIRFILALIATPIICFFLTAEGYVEELREKPKKMWEIFNFRSDLESKIKTMEEYIEIQKKLEKDLNESRERYSLALEGANAGIWEWDVKNNHIMYSSQFCNLLGFKKEELHDTVEVFKQQILHPEDVERTFALVDECFKNRKTFSIEYRLRTKDGGYKWFLSGGVVKFDTLGVPVKMVGSIIDIDEKKRVLSSYKEKVEELEKVNNLMVGRELQMYELKKEIERLRSNNKNG